MQLSIGGKQVGSTVANADGSFSTPITVSTGVGQVTVVAVCGPTLHATLNVVLTSRANTPASTAAILLVVLLLAVVVLRWEL